MGYTGCFQNAGDIEKQPLLSTSGGTSKVSQRIASVEVVRLLGIIHIVCYHFRGDSFSQWGCSWTSFFFILSGFGAAHSKLSKGQPGAILRVLPEFRTILRRVASVYPTYVFAIVACVVYRLFVLKESLWGQQLVVELAMLQAWFPYESYTEFAYNVPAWFISALALCWLLEEACFSAAAAVWHRGGMLVATLGCALWVFVWPYCTLGDPAVCAYWHCYFYGMILALHVRAAAPSSSLIPWATLSALAMLAAFVFIDALVYKEFMDLWARNCLIPFQSLLIVGLSGGRDPLAKLLDASPLAQVAHVSLGVYLLQAPLGSNWFSYPLKLVASKAPQLETPVFLSVLMLVAGVVDRLVQRPLSNILANLVR